MGISHRRQSWTDRGVGNERNLVHLVEKSVEIKLKSWEIKADFLEIKLGNQPNPPAPPTLTTYDVIFEGNHGKSKRNQEISYAKIARCRPLGTDQKIWLPGVSVSVVHWCRGLLLSFSTCYLGIFGLEGAINCILAWTSRQRTTSEKRTKALLPKCPLFGGSTVLHHIKY